MRYEIVKSPRRLPQVKVVDRYALPLIHHGQYWRRLQSLPGSWGVESSGKIPPPGQVYSA